VTSLQSPVAQHSPAGTGRHPVAEAVPLRTAAIVRLIRPFHFESSGLAVTDVTLGRTNGGGGAVTIHMRLEAPDERAPTDGDRTGRIDSTCLLTCLYDHQNDPLRRVGEGVLRSRFTPV
jgi:hypothetical protein